MRLDLTKYINWTKTVTFTTPGKFQYELIVNKRVYDEIRQHKGELVIMGQFYNLISLGTEEIGFGDDFTIDIRVTVKLTDWQLRENKLNQILK